jgi:hypothetical protein
MSEHEVVTVATRKEIENALRYLAPDIPDHEFGAIADHAMDSTGLRSAAPETAAWLSMVSFIRHVLTEYDSLLEEGYEQESARHFVAGDMQAVLKEWGVKRPLTPGE